MENHLGSYLRLGASNKVRLNHLFSSPLLWTHVRNFSWLRASNKMKPNHLFSSSLLWIVLVGCLSKQNLRGWQNAVKWGKIRAISPSPGDTILVSYPKIEHLDNLCGVIRSFENASGLNINCKKSEFLGIAMDDALISYFSGIYGCKKENWPTVYLGLPLMANQKQYPSGIPLLKSWIKDLCHGGILIYQKVVDTLSFKQR